MIVVCPSCWRVYFVEFFLIWITCQRMQGVACCIFCRGLWDKIVILDWISKIDLNLKADSDIMNRITVLFKSVKTCPLHLSQLFSSWSQKVSCRFERWSTSAAQPASVPGNSWTCLHWNKLIYCKCKLKSDGCY